MKKIALFVIALIATTCVVVISCNKAVKIPVSYSVVTNHADVVSDVFIPDTGVYDMQIMAKYFTGYEQDAVTLKITGLPADISVTPDSFSAVPTYVTDFVFHTNHAAHNTYRVTITGYAPGEKPQAYTFNLTVIPADCATTLLGNINGHNACSGTGSTNHTAQVTSTAPNTINIANFGGYGTVSAAVVLNCDNDSLNIPLQNIGNGISLQGKGVFTPTSMTIYYNATGVPAVGTDNCTVTYSK